MNSKTITRIVLLAVVAVAVGGWAVKEFSPTEDVVTDNGSDATTEVIYPDGVTVINFHGEKRCRTCIGIGDLARKTIDEESAAEEKSGRIHWRHINYEEADNAHFVTDYGLVSSTVVITLRKDGEEVKWERLDGVWDHYGDDATFRTYVAENVSELLKQL